MIRNTVFAALLSLIISSQAFGNSKMNCIRELSEKLAVQIAIPMEVQYVDYTSYKSEWTEYWWEDLYSGCYECDSHWYWEEHSSGKGRSESKYKVQAVSAGGVDLEYLFSGQQFTAQTTKFGSNDVSTFNGCCIDNNLVTIKDTTNDFEHEFLAGDLQCGTVTRKIESEAKAQGKIVKFEYVGEEACSEHGKRHRKWTKTKYENVGFRKKKVTKFEGCRFASDGGQEDYTWAFSSSQAEDWHFSQVFNSKREALSLFCSEEDRSIKVGVHVPGSYIDKLGKVMETTTPEINLVVDKKSRVILQSEWRVDPESKELLSIAPVSTNTLSLLRKGVNVKFVIDDAGQSVGRSMIFSLNGSSKAIKKLIAKCK